MINVNETVRVSNEWILTKGILNKKFSIHNFMEYLSVEDIPEKDIEKYGIDLSKEEDIYTLYYNNEDPFELCTLFTNDKDDTNHFIGGYINGEFIKNDTDIDYIPPIDYVDTLVDEDIDTTGIEDCF